MSAASLAAAQSATSERLATRNPSTAQRLAGAASRVEEKVAKLRRLLLTLAPKGFAAEVASIMEWRIERRGRELCGAEKLSLADIAAEIEIHTAHGRQDAVDEIVSALLDGLTAATVPVAAGSVMRVFDRNGQLFLRFER